MTPAILDLFAGVQVKASFFVLGRNIAGREDILRRAAREGHAICSHGFDHRHAWKTWPWHGIADIKRGWRAIDQALGVEGGRYPYRPPYGKLNIVTLLWLWLKRVPIVLWTVDSRDTWAWPDGPPDGASVAKAMAKGGVLLAHDFDRTDRSRDEYVLRVLKAVLEIARKHDLNVVTVSPRRGHQS